MKFHVAAVILASIFRIGVATPVMRSSCKSGGQAPKDLCHAAKKGIDFCWKGDPASFWKEIDGVQCQGICDPSGEPLIMACMDYVADETQVCTVGDRQLKPKPIFKGTNKEELLIEACSTLADMCIDWAPRFIEAKARGVDLDCDTFAEETSWRWRGACSVPKPGRKVTKVVLKQWVPMQKPGSLRGRYKEPTDKLDGTAIDWVENTDESDTKEPGGM